MAEVKSFLFTIVFPGGTGVLGVELFFATRRRLIDQLIVLNVTIEMIWFRLSFLAVVFVVAVVSKNMPASHGGHQNSCNDRDTRLFLTLT